MNTAVSRYGKQKQGYELRHFGLSTVVLWTELSVFNPDRQMLHLRGAAAMARRQQGRAAAELEGERLADQMSQVPGSVSSGCPRSGRSYRGRGVDRCLTDTVGQFQRPPVRKSRPL